MTSEKGKALLGGLVEGYSAQYAGEDDISRMMLSMLFDMPLRSLAMFGAVKIETLEEIVGETGTPPLITGRGLSLLLYLR